MKPHYIYISLLFFMACLIAPSLAVLTDLKVKETKVAKLFDMEEEDTRDSDSETETEKNPEEKFFKSILASLDIILMETMPLVHYTPFHFQLQDISREQLTPPPRA
ncbi:MAG: hypothetical protein JWM14_129 [Chitinophagaceae bacterium]|nr:hypothetical protein [Chitinophagaceae bacterium]